MIRVGLLVILLAFLVWAGWAGERGLKRCRNSLPVVCQGCLNAYLAAWRMLMLTIGIVSIIAVVGLWAAQDASDEAKHASTDLCNRNVEWQQTVLDIRETDVRLSAGELEDAENELDDTEAALADATQSGVINNPFVAAFLQRDIKRAQHHVETLQAEVDRRTGSVSDLERQAIDICPP